MCWHHIFFIFCIEYVHVITVQIKEHLPLLSKHSSRVCLYIIRLLMDLAFGSEIPKLDVLIVGAGLSGLTSGVKLLEKEKSLKFKIIDADLPGGLIRGANYRSVGDEQTEMISFMNQLNISLNKADVHKDESLNRCWDLDRCSFSAPIKFELGRYINMIELRMEKYRPQRIQYRDRAPSMERHICYHLFFRQSRQFMFNLVELATGVAPSDITYDEFMGMCSGCGGLSVIINMYFRQSNSSMVVSCERLLDALLEKLKTIEISTNEKVLKINHFKDYVQVVTTQSEPYTAQAVILAIPWDKICKLEFNPPIPKPYANKLRCAKGKKRVLTQYLMHYNKSYWETCGFSGAFMNTMPMVVGNVYRPGEYGGYILHSTDESNVKEIVTGLLSENFGQEMMEPRDFQQETIQINGLLGQPQTEPWLRVIWSSSSVGATNNRNLMGGAVESGLRAAINALYLVRPQVVSWRDLKSVSERPSNATYASSVLPTFFSRLNLYNCTFYSFVVIGLVAVLNYGYCPP